MAGNYEKIIWQFRDTDGTPYQVPAGLTVKARKVGVGLSDVAESPLTTNSDGETVADSIAALSPGDLVNFRIENYEGMATSVTVRLT